MNYGKGPVPTVAGVAMLPATGNNQSLFIVAASLIVIGLAVYAITLFMTRKSQKLGDM